ncbi:MAG: DUF4340 domain-containing protein [Deltaproteobacteria bacterium]|nr:DUF4340 domain-containing protein [Deltaproteobacteria bacterium]
MQRANLVHGGLAIFAISLALVAWQKPTANSNNSDIKIISGEPEQTQEINWVDDQASISIKRHDNSIKVAITKKPKPAATQEQKTTTEVYPANEKAQELFSALVPFSAARDLGIATDAELVKFGLVDPKTKLSLHIDNKQHDIQIGNSAFGSGSTYVKAADKHVYLVKTSLFNNFKGVGNGLIERRLIIAKPDTIEKVIIYSDSKKRELIQHFAENRKKTFFADPAEPETQLKQATNWLDRLMQTRINGFADQVPATLPALRVEWFDDKKSLGNISIWAAENNSAIAKDSDYDAPVKISKITADSLIKDISSVLNESR